MDKSPQTRNSGSHRSGLGPWRAIHRRSWTTRRYAGCPADSPGQNMHPSRRLVWNLVSSSFSLPSGVITTTSSARTSSRPTTLSTHSPSIGPLPGGRVPGRGRTRSQPQRRRRRHLHDRNRARHAVDASVVEPKFLCGWRRSGACIARPTREGYRVVCRPRRTPRGACLGGAKRKET
jgi:hypothetical protein